MKKYIALLRGVNISGKNKTGSGCFWLLQWLSLLQHIR